MRNAVCIYHPAGGNISLFACLQRLLHVGVKRLSFTTRCRSFALDVIVFLAITKPFEPEVIGLNRLTEKRQIYINGCYFTSLSSHWHATTNFRRKKNPAYDLIWMSRPAQLTGRKSNSFIWWKHVNHGA